VTVSKPRCGWSGNPAGAETATHVGQEGINSTEMEHVEPNPFWQNRIENSPENSSRTRNGSKYLSSNLHVSPISKRSREMDGRQRVANLTCRCCGGRRRRRPRTAAAPGTCAPPVGASPWTPTSAPNSWSRFCFAQVRRRRLCQLALPLPLQASRYIAARACRFSSKATARSLADLSSFSLPRSLGKAYIKPTPWAHLPKSLCWTAAAGGHADAMPTQAFLRCPAPCVGRPLDNQ
jgi:hypothetical protein